MRYLLTLLGLLFTVSTLTAETFYVSPDRDDPAGHYFYIQDAIDRAEAGDTVRLLPGRYSQSFDIDKEIYVMGCSFLATDVSANGTVVTMSAGQLSLMSIQGGDIGVTMSGGTITNCVIRYCGWSGIKTIDGECLVTNTVIHHSGVNGVSSIYPGNVTIVNCIIYNCPAFAALSYGTIIDGKNHPGGLTARFNCSYNNGSHFAWPGGGLKCPGMIVEDPQLDKNYRPSETSPVIDKGEGLVDRDGSAVDMGVYGGPNMTITPCLSLPADWQLNDDGTVKFIITGKGGY